MVCHLKAYLLEEQGLWTETFGDIIDWYRIDDNRPPIVRVSTATHGLVHDGPKHFGKTVGRMTVISTDRCFRVAQNFNHLHQQMILVS